VVATGAATGTVGTRVSHTYPHQLMQSPISMRSENELCDLYREFLASVKKTCPHNVTIYNRILLPTSCSLIADVELVHITLVH